MAAHTHTPLGERRAGAYNARGAESGRLTATLRCCDDGMSFLAAEKRQLKPSLRRVLVYDRHSDLCLTRQCPAARSIALTAVITSPPTPLQNTRTPHCRAARQCQRSRFELDKPSPKLDEATGHGGKRGRCSQRSTCKRALMKRAWQKKATLCLDKSCGACGGARTHLDAPFSGRQSETQTERGPANAPRADWHGRSGKIAEATRLLKFQGGLENQGGHASKRPGVRPPGSA